MRRKLTLDEFIAKSNLVHKNKYDYSKSKYVDARTKVVIICPIHGEFLQVPFSHFIGKGCSACTENKPLNTNEFISRCRKVHTKKYDYSAVDYKGTHTKVAIICPKHGKFCQRAKDHLNGVGCPKCQSSKGELKILNFLNKSKIEHKYQYWFIDCRSNIGKKQVLKFDFYIPSKNLLVEYDGEQHYNPNCYVGKYKTTSKDFENIICRDKIKTKYALKAGIRLLRIKYTQFNRIDQILEAVLRA